MAPRGCGSGRTAGSIYLECPLSDVGLPVEHFLVDTPVRINANEFGLSPVGVKVIEREGIYHVWDIVGQEHYPNLADFVEEVGRLGLSRKVSPTLDFKKLTPQSKIILLHSRAYDHNFAKYPKKTLRPCPKSACTCPQCKAIAADHDIGTGKCLKCMCAACWWHNLEGDLRPTESGDFTRTMPAFQYRGYPRPERVKPKYDLAIFMRLPIHNFAVIRDPENGRHEQAEAKASESSIPVELKDE